MTWGLFLTTVLNLNLARFLNVAVVSYLVNRSRSSKSKLNKKTQFVMWFAGLRGAMAYALALQASQSLAIGPIILIDTLLYSLFTILVFGSVLHPLLNKMDVKNKSIVVEEQIEVLEERRQNCCNRFKQNLSWFDTNYFAPIFIKDVRSIDLT